MPADHLRGPVGGVGEASNREAGGIGGEDGVLRGEFVQLPEDAHFQAEVFRHRLDDEVRRPRRRRRGR